MTLLSKAKEDFNLNVYGYFTMTSHLHLIIKANLNELSKAMKWLNSSYALFFYAKYGRLGYVFAARYRSECIDTFIIFVIIKVIRNLETNNITY